MRSSTNAESEKHIKLKAQAKEWLVNFLSAPRCCVQLEVMVAGRIVDVYCDNRKSCGIHKYEIVVECGAADYRKLKHLYDAGCDVYHWPYGAIKPFHFTPNEKIYASSRTQSVPPKYRN